jgi:polysaccharide biosynthesis protein PslF
MSSPRVLLVSGDFPPFVSGVGDFVDKLAASLSAAGADVSVLTTISSDENDANRPFRVLRAIDGWGLSQRNEILRIARQGYDIVDIQYPGLNYGRSPMINLLPALLRVCPGSTRTVLTVHDFRVMRHRWRARVAPMMWAVDGLIHVDEKDWPWMQAWGVSQTKPRAHIPIAANAQPVPVTADSRMLWREDLGFAEDETVVAFFGILYPHKGITELVECISQLRNRDRKIRLLVLGDFDRDAEWCAPIEKTLNDPAVRWLRGATLEKVSRGLHAADLAALPFHSGASTNRGSMLAALAHGLPTVTTQGPATPPDFAQYFDVDLVPVNNSAALADAISRLMDDPDRRLQMRKTALARNRDWSAVASETLAFYRRLIETHNVGVA